MNPCIISSITDLETGTAVKIALSYPVEAVSLIVMYQDLTSTGWTESAQALATSIDLTLPDSRLYDFIVVAVDVSGNYSLPSNKMGCLPTSGNGSIERRIEKNIVATLETITTTNGYFDTVDDVVRISYRIDAEHEDDFFLLVAFDTVEAEFAAHYGADVIDTQMMDVSIVACHKGRDKTLDWIKDTIDKMLYSIQQAIFEDRSRGGLALDTTPIQDDLRPEDLKNFVDAVCVKKFNVTYRTLRTDPTTSGLC